MKLNKFWFGMLATIMVLMTVSGAVALLGTDSTKIESITIQDSLDSDIWWIIDAYNNADGSITHCTTQPAAVAAVEKDYLVESKGYQETIVDENTGLPIANPQSKRNFALEHGVGHYHRDNYVAGENNEWKKTKPIHEFN